MFGAISAAVFGTSRSKARAVAVAYLAELTRAVPGETVSCGDVIKDFASLRSQHGWPKLPPEKLLNELSRLGCPSFHAIKVPWLRPAPPAIDVDPPQTVAPAEDIEQPLTQKTIPKQASKPKTKVKRNPSPNGREKNRDKALASLLARLARGETIPSQKVLSEELGVAKGTISKWLRDWERAGLMPARAWDGRCNVIRLQPKTRVA